MSTKTAGIFQAHPTVEKLRWQAPKKLPPTDKTFDAKNFGFMAVQMDDPLKNIPDKPQSEDCLTLNIWARGDGKNKTVSIDYAFDDSGYLGLKDQIAALRWVKENISEFGGNPDNITIFGHSSGSISVMLLTIAPAAKNLFQKAIPQS